MIDVYAKTENKFKYGHHLDSVDEPDEGPYNNARWITSTQYPRSYT